MHPGSFQPVQLKCDSDGRAVGQGTVRPVQKKIQAVACYPTPATKKCCLAGPW